MAVDINALEKSAAGRGIEAVRRGLTEIPFVQFTTDLVSNVYKTVVNAQIEQLEAYADLVGAVAGTLANYEARFIGLTQQQQEATADAYITDVLALPAPSGTSTTFTLTDPQKAALVAHFDGVLVPLAAELDPTSGQLTVTTEAAADPIAEAIANLAAPYDIKRDDLRKYVIAKLKEDARISYEKLVTILQLGMARVEITDGSIETRLTIHMDSQDSDERTSTTTENDYSSKSLDWNANLGLNWSRSVAGRVQQKLAGAMIRRSFGGNFGAGAAGGRSSGHMKVTVVNEKSTAVTNMSADVVGGVKLNFRTVSFPPFDPAAKPAAG